MFDGIKYCLNYWNNNLKQTEEEEEDHWPLPVEIYDKIFDYFDNKNKFLCRAVCKLWKEILEKKKLENRCFSHPVSIKCLLGTYNNLKTENYDYIEGDKGYIPFYEKYFFNAYPCFNNSVQQKQFKVHGNAVFYPMRNFLCKVTKSGESEIKIVEKAYDEDIGAIAVGRSIVLTTGKDKIKKTVNNANKIKRCYYIKVWNAEDLSFIASLGVKKTILCLQVIDETRFLTGNSKNCSLRELKITKKGAAICEIAKLAHGKPVTFAHYFLSEGRPYILTEDNENSIHLWQEQVDDTNNIEAIDTEKDKTNDQEKEKGDEVEKADLLEAKKEQVENTVKTKWVEIKILIERKKSTAHFLAGAANMIFEGFLNSGDIRLNGSLNRKNGFFALLVTASYSNKFKWMQYDSGGLYVALKETNGIECLDFTKESVKKASMHPSLEKLEEDLNRDYSL